MIHDVHDTTKAFTEDYFGVLELKRKDGETWVDRHEVRGVASGGCYRRKKFFRYAVVVFLYPHSAIVLQIHCVYFFFLYSFCYMVRGHCPKWKMRLDVIASYFRSLLYPLDNIYGASLFKT